MATLIIQNQTGNTLTYSSTGITVSANANYTTSVSQIFPAARDPQLISDCINGIVYISDGTLVHTFGDAVTFLGQVAAALGSAVIGYVGTTAPPYQILVGAKDPSGNIQPGRVNQFTDLSVNFRNSYRNITGNTTVTVKSGSGTLHAIVVNRNWTGGTITVYDNTAGSGTVIMNLDAGSPSGGLLSTSGMPGPAMIGPLGVEFTTGLTIVTSGSGNNNITVLYQ